MSDEDPTTILTIGGSSLPPTIGGRVGSWLGGVGGDNEEAAKPEGGGSLPPTIGGIEAEEGPNVGGIKGGGSLPPTMGGKESKPASPPLAPITGSSPSSSCPVSM